MKIDSNFLHKFLSSVEPSIEDPSYAARANAHICSNMETDEHEHACNTIAQMYYPNVLQ